MKTRAHRACERGQQQQQQRELLESDKCGGQKGGGGGKEAPQHAPEMADREGRLLPRPFALTFGKGT
jgi:hypothetical protein